MPAIMSESTVGFWFIPIDGKSDFSGILNQLEPDLFAFDCRFRYYVNQEVFTGQDHFSWYHVEIRGTKEESIEQVRTMIETVKNVAEPQFEADEVLNEGSIEKMFEVLKTKSWFHYKTSEGDEWPTEI